MLITCPNCATRYDVEDARFLPEGRSVRCAECGESWHVDPPVRGDDNVVEDAYHDPGEFEDADFADAGFDDAAASTADDDGDEPVGGEVFGDEVFGDDAFGDRATDFDRRDVEASDVDQDGDAPSARRRPRFAIVDEDEDEDGPRAGSRPDGADDYAAFFDDAPRGRREDPFDWDDEAADDADELFADASRVARAKDDVEGDARSDAADEGSPRRDRSGGWRPDARARRAAAEVDDDLFGDRDAAGERGGRRDARAPSFVDADFEDLTRDDRAEDNDFDDSRAYAGDPRLRASRDFAWDGGDAADGPARFGARLREQRRRSTALMRVDDLDPIAERIFSDEFFTALRVQPKDLEKAIRKARRRAEARDKNRMSPLKAAGWTAWAAAVAAVGFVAYAFRDNIVVMFPNAADAYEAVGIEATPFGLKIEGVRHRLAMSTAGPTIEITGQLRNAAGAVVAPPLLQAEALGPGGDLLSRWTFAADADQVGVGESVDFITRAPAPDGVVEVALSFAPSEGVRVSVGDPAPQDAAGQPDDPRP